MTDLISAVRVSQLRSTTAGGEGASLIGTDSKTNLGAATTVEAALTFLNTFVASAVLSSGLNELIDDRMNAVLVEGTGVTLTYNDTAGTITIDVDVSGDLEAGDIPSGVDSAKIADGSVSNAEFQYLNGVTSAIQTQIDGKAASSHTHSTSDVTGLVEFVQDTIGACLVEGDNITITYSDGGNTITIAAAGLGDLEAGDLPSGIDAAKIADASVSNAEFQYLNGVTSAIQTQIDGKAASSHTHSTSDVTGLVEFVQDTIGACLVEGDNITITYDDSGNTITIAAAGLGDLEAGDLPSGIDAAKIADGSVSNAEFQYLNGVGSAIQTQIDGKAASSHTHAVGDVTGLQEYIEDTVAALIADGTNVTTSYNDGAGSFTINATGGGGGSTDADDIDAGTLDVEFGGTGADLSATGPGYLKQATTGDALTVGAIAAGDLPTAIDAAKIADGSVSNTEFQYLNGVSGALQTQIDGKAASSHTHTASQVTDFAEAVDDRLNAVLVEGGNITLDYDDSSNTLTISAADASGGDGGISSVTYADPLVISGAGKFKVTLTGSPEVQISGPTAGQIVRIRFLQDGTGGFNPTWDDAMTIKWAGGSPPTIEGAANKATWIGLICTGSNAYDGFVLSADH